jgi:hypothetical protein
VTYSKRWDTSTQFNPSRPGEERSRDGRHRHSSKPRRP